ncbi:TetR/AcrR family transcriptional regulator [Streptomyces sp. XC 2026]|uniref:TetR/AcrR family transcriptional regulator n=1 Tax=Streptomyces sp. XC 2026 TaxID=2782004 RepID=UPI0019038861|nr:TetR/AcrR family transcriptional regulator [Streptomyces sp. XC 2026]QQN79531.1 TetR/AcrR family transcriptional regulator [Streptomyces sp. XC 2026]
MTAIRGARERARREVTAAIKNEARAQLAAEGAAKLSLRAVARELGMASSALYRYFPSRDDLLTALIIDAYDMVGEAAESALAAAPPSRPPLERWLAVCHAVREWALAHPHEYALIYGSPIPGYAAPASTVGPASRVALTLIAVIADTHARGDLAPPAGSRAPDIVTPELTQYTRAMPPEAAPALITAWTTLFGLISFELFGHFHNVVRDPGEFLTRTMTARAGEVGLPGAGPDTH